MRRFSCSFAIAVLILSLPAAAFGWNSTGHRVVALIAYKTLDGPTRIQVCNILKDHPAAASLWVGRDVNSSDDAQASMFLNAATFPDDARPRTSEFFPFSKPTDHYVNFQLDKAGNLGAPAGNGSLLTSFQQNLMATRTAAKPADRAIALSWIFHQVGDAHQPLHAVARFSDKFPMGDEGGNLVKPFPDPRGKFQELHGYWDDLLGSDTDVDQFNELDSIADDIMNLHPANTFGLDMKKLDITLWTRDEGGPLARDVVYRPLLITVDDGDGFSKLPNGYEIKAQAVGRERVALAGYRLAEQLKKLFP